MEGDTYYHDQTVKHIEPKETKSKSKNSKKAGFASAS